MARDIDHVVDAAGDPVITVLVAAAAVAGEVLARISLEIGVDEPLMITVDSAHLAWPGIGDAQVAGAGPGDLPAFGVDQLRDDAEERSRRRAGFQFGRAGQRRDEDAARLRLPPGIDDRA